MNYIGMNKMTENDFQTWLLLFCIYETISREWNCVGMKWFYNDFLSSLPYSNIRNECKDPYYLNDNLFV